MTSLNEAQTPEAMWAAVAVVISVVSLLMSGLRMSAADRPILTAILPYETDGLGPIIDRTDVLEIENQGGIPGVLTRIVRHVAYTEDQARYPCPLDPEMTYSREARARSHIIPPNNRSQRLQLAPDFEERIIGDLADASLNVFVQVLLEYEDLMGRKYRSISQYRYVRERRGFHLAWPGDPDHCQHELAGKYVSDEVLVGFWRAALRNVLRVITLSRY